MAAVVLCRRDQILLLYRQGSRVVNNMWIGSAGGHFEKDELNDAEACALRELGEELSVTRNMLSDLSLRYITLRRAEGEIRINYYYFATLRDECTHELTSNEGRLQWFHHEEIGSLPMAFTAHFVMEHYLKTGRYDRKLYGGIANSTGVVFTELPSF